jgi:hypothetical protein
MPAARGALRDGVLVAARILGGLSAGMAYPTTLAIRVRRLDRLGGLIYEYSQVA